MISHVGMLAVFMGLVIQWGKYIRPIMIISDDKGNDRPRVFVEA